MSSPRGHGETFTLVIKPNITLIYRHYCTFVSRGPGGVTRKRRLVRRKDMNLNVERPNTLVIPDTNFTL